MIFVGDIQVTLKPNVSGGIRVNDGCRSILLPKMSMDEAAGLIQENYSVVYAYYIRFVTDDKGRAELQQISLNIVLHYLYMYNNWRANTAQMSNLDLHFKNEDFNSPGTFDIITWYYKEKHPKSWKEKSAVLMGFNMEAFSIKYAARELFYNK